MVMMDPLASAKTIGRDVLGPAFAVHAHRVVQLADQRRLDRLYFLARDGWLLRQLYRVVEPLHRRAPPEDAYLHVSRRSTALAAVERFGPREVRLGLRPPARHTLRHVLHSFALDDDETLALVARAGAASLDERFPWPSEHAPLHLVLDDAAFQAHVARRAAEARRRLLGYLRQHLFLDAGRVGVVDVGWHGTVQDNLERALALGGAGASGPSIRGLYFGLYAEGEPAARKQGTVFDERARGAGLNEFAPLQFVQLFEEAARTDEGTTIDYQETSNGFEALLKDSGPDRDAERAALPTIRALQAGVTEHVRAYAADAAAGRAPALAELRAESQRRIERFIFRPTADEVRALAGLLHADDWAEVRFGHVVPEAGDDAAPSPWRSPRRWLDRFYDAYWKPAYLLRTAGPLACRLFELYESAKLWRSQRAR
jgi:hypothetical protein